MHMTSAIKEALAKIRSLPRGKRWEYIWEYYRLTFFLTAFSLFFLWAIGSFLINGVRGMFFPKESVSIAFAVPGFSDNRQWQDDCLTAIGFDPEREDFRLLVTAPHSDTSDDFRIAASVWLANGQPDVFVVDEATAQLLLEMEVLANFSETWPQELQQLAADKMVDSWRLDLSGTGFASSCGLTKEPVYLCMYADGCGFSRALEIVEYILAGN